MQRLRVAEIVGYGLSIILAMIGTWLMLAPAGPEMPPPFPHFDKVAHFVVFFLIALPAVAVRPRAWAGIVLSASALGGAIELIQPFVGREREFADFVADVLGALAAVPVGHALARGLSKLRQAGEGKRA
ncbi:VanZ family protein [Natronohydrobacter thiooxidans]|uniref:VanZ family protein n=1 Tax=Natronohydrobacter thiooxidans TaxID=87172 RepID=UPI001587AAD7|nr:VanZ family protein [Natronohydrobacter thiooxidans]